MSEIKINIRCSNATKFTVSVDPEGTTVGDFKERIAEEADVPAPNQRLIYRGRVLKDDQQLSFYGVTEDQTIHLVKGSGPAKGAPPSATNESVGTGVGITQANTATSTLQSTGEGQRGLLGSNPDVNNPFLAATMGGAGTGDAGILRMQQQLMSNPETMANFMNSPMMQSMLNNPETLQSLMMSNPQMQQVVENNPQLAHILNDPAIMQQTLEMLRNPNAMREMMRSQDLAMSQIENHPEGFNFLRRMYTDIQEPVMQASINQAQSMQRGLGGVGSSGPTGRTTQPTGGPMPNPWATPSATTPSSVGMTGSGGMGGLEGSGGMGGTGGAEGGLSPWAMGTDMARVNPQQMMEMMQDPMVQQMMNGFLSNPDNLDQMIAANPMLQQAVAANPQLRDQLPRMMQSMVNPDILQAVMQMQDGMQTLHRAGFMPSVGATGLPDTAGNGTGPGPVSSGGGVETPAQRTGSGSVSGGLDFSSLLGRGEGTTGTATHPSAPTTNTPATPVQNPEERYSNQLSQLNAMGFSDHAANIRALVASQGNVSAAVERLISGSM